MADSTETPPRGTDTATGWCFWHEGPSETATVVRSIQRMSGPPFDLYACAPCREQRGLTPRVTA